MEPGTYTVAELASAISRAVARAFPEEVWVQGEIRDLSRASSGHVYFTLLDADDEAAPAALPVTLFASDKQAVNRVLARSGAVRMTDGIAVRIRGRVAHYPRRGTVQLRMTWIDTDFTLGKLAAERDRLVRSLADRGLLDRNSVLPMPLVPLHLGLITSLGSAAHADFVDEIGGSGYAFRIAAFDARVQGPDAGTDIVRGLAELTKRKVDVIAIVRGGGAKTDLATFDQEELAIAVARCPIPVVTGVGHETDVSVVDLVARDFKTPTACAAGLVARVREFSERIDGLALAIQRSVRRRLDVAAGQLGYAAGRARRSAVGALVRAGQHVGYYQDRIRRGSRQTVGQRQRQLVSVQQRIGRASHRQVGATETELERTASGLASTALRAANLEKHRIEEVARRLALIDPERLLARGWSLTRTTAGELVTDPTAVDAGDRLQTTVVGGVIHSRVTEESER